MNQPTGSPHGTRRRVTAASTLVVALLATLLALVPAGPASADAEGEGTVSAQGTLGDGYFFVATDGGIFNFGDSEFKGSTGDIKLNQPIVGAESTPTGEGYWLVASDGGIFTFGDAKFLGSTGDIKLNKPIVAMVATPTGNGYWLFATDGGVFTFGDADFFGSTGDLRLNQPIVGADATPTGRGYYLVASDGGIFTFGDAEFFGSAGGIKLNKPIVGMAALDDGDGYYLVATDGGIFSYGRTADDAQFFGSTGNLRLNQPIVGMDLTASNQGYYLVAADGGIFSFGDAEFLGSTGNIALNKPIVGMRVTPNSPVEAPDFVVDLRGSKEVPGPGDADGNGFALIDFSDDELCYNLKVNSIAGATAAHIHEAPAGQAGPVVITLAKPDANGTAEACQDVDRALVAEILANPQNYYVNVHNGEFPGGAVRGQLEGEIGVAVASNGDVLVFDTEFPELTEKLFSLPATVPAAAVVGLDFRPKTREGYVLVRVAPDAVQVVKANSDGTGTALGAPIPVAPAATTFGFDFNPTSDQIRVVNDADQSFRVSPDTGAVIPSADEPLEGGADGNPDIAGVAYFRNIDQTGLAAADRRTTLFGIDHQSDNLNTINITTGVVTPVGALGVDLASRLSFDIAPAASIEDFNSAAFVVSQRAGSADLSELFAINTTTTADPAPTTRAASHGVIGDGTVTVVAFAIF
ncbi:MAG TPA: DUF4394 domain-containing protein [Acidimicrobiales bacterium]|nr:DUF4394 domain-containing protein [Acidimicrobiales bacterium]